MSEIKQRSFTLSTQGRGMRDITSQIYGLVASSDIAQGLCHIFLQHTSASLLISENADPQVGRDLENFLQRLVPDGDPLFKHNDEGPDDMPAHIRTILTNCFLVLPIHENRLALGTWQGIFLYEHRHESHQRQVMVTLMGSSND